MKGERMVMVASHLPNRDLACPAQTGTAAGYWSGRRAVVPEVLGYPRWESLEASVLSLWALVATQPFLATKLGHRCLT